ncbi:MAG TPA: transcriptional repressor LexA [Verrucomicrobiales bacterium]|nr:transcriptional repressor LexA [Verrucomicrobiales bacterium]
MNQNLTTGQSAVLRFIRRYSDEHGHPPTDREIQEGMGFGSPSVARHYLGVLERKGALQRRPGKARGIILPDARPPRPMLSIPLLGGITAGFPVDAVQDSESCIMVDAASLRLPSNAKTFALKVRGDSMTGVSILDGDYVIMDTRDPKPGDIVAALVDNETTLKTYIIRRGKPCLRAENPRYPDIIPGRELVIQGVMVAVLRVPQTAA